MATDIPVDSAAAVADVIAAVNVLRVWLLLWSLLFLWSLPLHDCVPAVVDVISINGVVSTSSGVH